MRTSEKKLFLMLCVAVFIAINMLGFHAYLGERQSLQKGMAAAKSELAEEKSWLQLGESIAPADHWINSHPMPRITSDDASAQLLKVERDEAEKAGLKITEENLLPAQDSDQGNSAAVTVKLTGPFEGVVKMLFAMQSPTAWRTLDKLTLKSDAQPPNVIAEMEIRQYFQVPAASENPKTP